MPDSTRIILYLKNSDKQLSEIKRILLQTNTEKLFLGIRENYWTHVILPVCIPLLAFFLGRLYTTINDKLKRLSELKNKERFLFTWISLVQEPIKNQAKVYKEYATELRELKIEQLVVLNLHLDKLKATDSITLVALIVTNRIGKEEIKNSILFSYENTVDALKRKDESTKSLLDLLQKSIDSTHSVWNENYKNAQEVIQELYSVGSSLTNPKMIDDILEIFALYTKTKEKGMISCMNNFVSKAGPICSDYMNLYPDDKIIRRLLNFLGQMKHAYESHNKHFLSFAENFEEASSFMLKKSQVLLKIKDDIAELKYKNFLFIK